MRRYQVPADIKDDFVKHCDKLFNMNEIYSYHRIGSLDRYVDACGDTIEDFIDFDGVHEPLRPLFNAIFSLAYDTGDELTAIFIDFESAVVWVG